MAHPRPYGNYAGADFSERSLIGVSFAYADLRGANFYDADCGDANFTGANLKGANFERVSVARAIMQGANLQGLRFKDAILNKANMSGANAAGACFRRCEIENITAIGTNFNNADFTYAMIRGGDYTRSDWAEARASHDLLNVHKKVVYPKGYYETFTNQDGKVECNLVTDSFILDIIGGRTEDELRLSQLDYMYRPEDVTQIYLPNFTDATSLPQSMILKLAQLQTMAAEYDGGRD